MHTIKQINKHNYDSEKTIKTNKKGRETKPEC